MILFKEASSLQNFLHKLKQESKIIGFVPTMGALHQGHMSLVNLTKQHVDIIIGSIFINPTQFNDVKDFDKYPVTLGQDILRLEDAGCDILFLPSVKEMYPGGTHAVTKYKIGNLENVLEGYYRPGHFQGVCQAVHRLLDIVQPHKLFMGQKDYQQCLVIKTLIASLQLPVSLVIGPTVRESSGLAMSSRNMRLNHDEKHKAAAIYHTLQYINNNYTTTPLTQLTKYAEGLLEQSGFSKVDYVSIVNRETLEQVHSLHTSTSLVALIAAYMGEVRLIDNMVLQNKG